MRADFIVESNIPLRIRKSQENLITLLSQGVHMNLDIRVLIMHKLNLCLQALDGVSSKSLTRVKLSFHTPEVDTLLSQGLQLQIPFGITLLSQGLQLQIPFEKRDKNKYIERR